MGGQGTIPSYESSKWQSLKLQWHISVYLSVSVQIQGVWEVWVQEGTM